ncbi:hypothetical protein CASFOL_031660 [Castilleja foliolosa]|uniref:Uncharacterized protein n=1 Tax=Castilleja foliolosa TaxID=1961234 RepID=A0ABD3C8A8_9LAMI
MARDCGAYIGIIYRGQHSQPALSILGKDFNGFIDPSSSSVSDSVLFDASQYTFFGKGTVDDVELGGLEDGNNVPVIGGRFNGEDELNNEYHLFDKDEGSGLGSLSDIDDLATTFAKINKVVKDQGILELLVIVDLALSQGKTHQLQIGHEIQMFLIGSSITYLIRNVTRKTRDGHHSPISLHFTFPNQNPCTEHHHTLSILSSNRCNTVPANPFLSRSQVSLPSLHQDHKNNLLIIIIPTIC